MTGHQLDRRDGAFNLLRRLTQARVEREQCELCSKGVGSGHQHLIEPAARRLVCVCDACAVLFPGTHTKYRRVPRTIRSLPDVQISDAQWDSLLIPIGLAFFYENSQAGRVVAIYPSPAGPTESLLPLETWHDIVRENPVLARMEPDVEALVARRLDLTRREEPDAGRHEYYVLPIDECFRLVGLIRLHWKGLSGGTEVWSEISRFFSGIRARAGESQVHGVARA
jgi:hypothetical protein